MRFTRVARVHSSAWIRTLLLSVVVLAAGKVGSAQAQPQSLIAGRLPVASHGVKNPARLTDGMYSMEGDEWLTDVTSRFTSGESFVEYSLGDELPVRCAMVQADNNDIYSLSGSLDGKNWQPLWVLGAHPNAGMRLRAERMETTARYIRLSATRGDALYSVSEIALYSQCPSVWPPVIAGTRGVPVSQAFNTKLIMFGILASLFLILHRKRAGKLQYVLLLPALGAGCMVVSDLAELYPFFEQEPQLRALVALLATLVLVKEAFCKKAWEPHKTVVVGTLALTALTAFGTYYHFGMPQFMDEAKGRRTLVHTWDMRHYFPVAKYFRELRFDGLYVGSLAAYLDNNPNYPRSELANVHLRDLRDAEMSNGAKLADEVEAVRKRFTPERWEEFKRDMKYFTETMGDRDYLGSMGDHGGNATPVWILPAHFIFKYAPASELSLSLAGLIDPVLVLLFFGILYRAYGWRTMLYVATLWGASDFYNFGSNLMGSTLRQDWLVAIGIGACLIKLGKPFWGGFLIAYAGLVRAFPAMATFFLAMPVVWFAVDYWRTHRRLPKVAELRVAQRPALRAMAGAAVCVVGLFLLTSAIFGAKDSWGTWYKKIEIHATGPSSNNVGLRNVLAFDSNFTAKALGERRHPDVWKEWEDRQRSTFAARKWLFYLLVLIATSLGLVACRGRTLEQASLIGLLMIPYYFYPSNYYCHYVFLIPMAVAAQGKGATRDRTFAVVFTVLALMAIGQYFTLLEGMTDSRYTWQSVLLLLGTFAILVKLAVESLQRYPLTLGASGTPPGPDDKDSEDDEKAEESAAEDAGANRVAGTGAA